MGGGDLLNLLIERDIFEEDFTRFYVAEASTLRSCGAVRRLVDIVADAPQNRWSWLLNSVTSSALSTVTLNQTWVLPRVQLISFRPRSLSVYR